METPDDLLTIVLDDAMPYQVVKIGAQLPTMIQLQLSAFLREFKDVFSWTCSEMSGTDPDVIVLRLNDEKNITTNVELRRTLNGERYLFINKEVEKLITANFIKAKFPKLVSNVVLVKKPNGRWRLSKTTNISTKPKRKFHSAYNLTIG